MIFRITTDFFIEAIDKDQAEQICKEDIDFIEHHACIDPASDDDLENLENSKTLDPSDKWYLEIYNK